MSCNRAFRQDPATRATTWCGECDKCLFIDLVLAPFVDRARARVGLFGGAEPIGDARDASTTLEVLVAASPTTPSRSSAWATPTSARRRSSPRPHGRTAPTSTTSPTLAARCVGAMPLDEMLVPQGPTNAPERDAARDLV